MINAISMITLRLEVGSFELELRQVDVAGDAPGLEGELLTAVNELGTGAGGFHLVVVDMVIREIVDMIIVDMVIVNMVIGDMVIVNMVMVNIIIVIMVKLATMPNQKLPSLSPPWFT